jgi:DNA polymerase type B, organellar and viral
MDNALKLGYHFDIIKGYEFEKGNIFEGYIDKLYNLRLQYEKGEPMNLVAKLLMNSLYGKFGMKNQSTIVEIFNTSDILENNIFNEMLETFGESIQHKVNIDNYVITVRDALISLRYNEEEHMHHGLDVNIAIASAITGGARMWMSIFKNNPEYKLYYSDTDSGVFDKPLPSYMVGDGLGKFKLEHVISRAVFLAPKVYAFITEDGEEIIKIKGVSKELLPGIHIQDLEDLLYINTSKELNQEKWFKKIIEGEITVSDVAYTLKVTSNKREAIYINSIFNNTKPYNYISV